jgi:hypothetical protein
VALLVATVTATCQIPARADHAYPFRWKQNPIQVYDGLIDAIQHTQARQEYRAVRGRVLTDWSQSGLSLPVQKIEPFPCAPLESADPAATVAQVPDGAIVFCYFTGQSGTAWAYWRTTGDTLVAAVVALPRQTGRAVMCHEFGHALGLRHSPRAGSCIHSPWAGSVRPDSQDLLEVAPL